MLKSVVVLLVLVVLFGNRVEAAKRCYSGQNARYAEKQCSSGSMSQDFTCQKFVCEGGKSPFTLRTCGQRNMGCLAGPRICQFSGGRGKCQRCDSDLCNMMELTQKAQFVMRSCGARNRRACDEEEKLCLEFLGVSRCTTCETDLCNGEPQPPASPLELQQTHLTNNGLFNFTNAKASDFNIDRIPSAINVNSKHNNQEATIISVFLPFLSIFCWAHFRAFLYCIHFKAAFNGMC